MTTHVDFAGLTDAFGARRRRAESLTAPLLRALGLVTRDPARTEPTTLAAVNATSDLLVDTLADLGMAEEELRAQNEALFAARTELEHDQQVYRDLFNLAPTPSLVTAAGGQILRINEAALALLARPVNAVIGKPFAAYVALADRPAFRAAFCRSLRSARVESWPVRLTPKHGDPIECRVRTRAIRAPSGTSCGSPYGSPPAVTDGPAVPALQWVITEELSNSIDDLV